MPNPFAPAPPEAAPGPPPAATAQSPPPPGAGLAPPPPPADVAWLQAELRRLNDQVQQLATTLSHQQSVFVDIAGARTAELHMSLAQIQNLATEMRGETTRLHELQDAVTHNLQALVHDVVRPELQAQLGQGLPQVVIEALAPELRRAIGDWLPHVVASNVSPELRAILAEWLPVLMADTVQPAIREAIAERITDATTQAVQPEIRKVLADRLPEVVASTVSPEVRALLSDWLPVMVADTVQPELRQAIAERLPDVTATAVQPEVRRVLTERLPHLVADTVQPEVYRALIERLPSVVADSVTPEVREAIAAQLPQLIGEAVRPEVRQTLEEGMPGVVGQVVGPEVRRVLAERLPHLVAESVQPEVRQTLADRLPHLVSETVRPELRATLDERLPGVVAQVVSPEVRRTLTERLPNLVAETVQPELRSALNNRLPGVISEVVSPAVAALLVERLPGMLAESVSPELSVTLAEMEGAAAELRHEAAKLRSLREVVAERLPESVMSAVEPHLHEVMAVRLPQLVSEFVEPSVRTALTEHLPALVAAAVRPDVSAALGERVPSLVAETVQPELRQIVTRALEERLPEVVADAVRPELRETISRSLPSVVAEAVTPEVVLLVAARLPALVGDVVSPDLTASLADLEGCAAEMRAETARMRGLREVVAERLPEAVMGAVQSVLEETIAARLPDMLARMVLPALHEAVSEPIPTAVQEAMAPALQSALAAELAAAIEPALERQVQLGLSESLPALVVSATEPSVRAALSRIEGAVTGIGDLREQVVDHLVELGKEGASISAAQLQSSSQALRAETERLSEVRAEIHKLLPAMIEEAVAVPLAEFEATAAQLRAEAERLRALRNEVAGQLPKIIGEAVETALGSRPQGPAPLPGPTQADAPAPDEPARAEAPAESEGGRAPAAEEALVEGQSGPQPGAAEDPPPPAGSATGAPAPAAVSAAGAPPLDPELAAALAPASPPANGARSADVAEDGLSVACSLPGLVVGPTLARGISEAVGRARLRRRRRRRAGPPAAGLHRRDPFATELTRKLEWFALARRQAANGAAANGQADPGLIPAGERDGHEVSVPLGSTGGLCLVGPRAREVARALVLTFLADNPHNAARVIVVGDLFPAATTFPGLGRARDVTSVLGGLQAEAARRTKLFREAGVNDLAAYRAQRPDDPLPLVLVAAAEMTTMEAGRLGAVLDDGARVGIAGVFVDAPLDGMLSIRLQGPARVASAVPEHLAGPLVGARLFTVDRDAAVELLDVLASARSDTEADSTQQPADEPFEAVAAEAPVISVRLLGNYRIDVNGREVRSGLRAKAKELLAFYLLHPEGTTLEEATEALWPEADAGRGSEWFWTALGNLRSRLRSATENSDLKVIEREGDRYRIEPLFEVDLWRFEDALAVAGAQSGDQSAWAEALQRAASFYSGELLTGVDWPWTEVPREDLRGRAVDVLVSLAATRLVAGDVRSALEALERAVEIDPLAEQLYRRIMRLHAKLSRPDQADAAFRALVARLGEFDLEPSAESEKLHEELCGTG